MVMSSWMSFCYCIHVWCIHYCCYYSIIIIIIIINIISYLSPKILSKQDLRLTAFNSNNIVNRNSFIIRVMHNDNTTECVVVCKMEARD